jgi:predicted transglutaminase-like cysteine proteinase
MRYLAQILVICIALFGAHADAHADAIFSSAPASADFSLFPGWQRVMMTENQSDNPHPLPVPAVSTLTNTNTSSGKPSENAIHEPICTDNARCGAQAWTNFIAEARKLPRSKMLDAVNRWVNKHTYVEDWANWGLPDYWETPREFLTRGGDCEDFAIIKYFTLRRLGFSAKDLRIMVVNDTNLQIYHSVLAVRQAGGEPLILDNQAADVIPASVVSQYHLIYSLNEAGWWLAAPPTLVVAKMSNNTVASSGGL